MVWIIHFPLYVNCPYMMAQVSLLLISLTRNTLALLTDLKRLRACVVNLWCPREASIFIVMYRYLLTVCFMVTITCSMLHNFYIMVVSSFSLFCFLIIIIFDIMAASMLLYWLCYVVADWAFLVRRWKHCTAS